MLRTLVACSALSLVLILTNGVSANPTMEATQPVATDGAATTPVMSRAAQRQAIRQTPLLMRPNRPGHFYGNTVRRLYYGR